MNLQMSDAEIVRSYKQAKDKNKQVEILADLNVCKKNDILDVLIKNDAITGLKKSKRKRKDPIEWTQEMTAELHRLHDEGLSTNQIAERMGLDALQVKNKLYRTKPKQKMLTEPETQERMIPGEEAPMPAELHELISGLKIAFGIADSMSAVNFGALSCSNSIAVTALTLREFLRQLCDEAESMKASTKKSPRGAGTHSAGRREESRNTSYTVYRSKS